MSRIRRVMLEIDEATGNVSCTFTTCCVSWAEMLEAVVLMRAKLEEQISTSNRCPYSPTNVPTVGVEEISVLVCSRECSGPPVHEDACPVLVAANPPVVGVEEL